MKAGYTGVAFWDTTFAFIAEPFWPRENVLRLQEVIAYAAAQGMRVMGAGAPFGWSNAALVPDGNLAEASRILGARFRVNGAGRAVHIINSLPPLINCGFEHGRAAWFGAHDPGAGIGEVAHSGKHSASVVDAPGNARFRQKVVLTPWRQYHVSLWYKSSAFHGAAIVEVQDWWHRQQVRLYAELHVSGSRDWQRLDLTFNSRETNAAYLYFGVWGGSSGIIWFDDVGLEETGPVYIVRREGAPLRVYDPEDQRTQYQEGRDFDRVYDPVLSPPRAVLRDVYHAPVRTTLPAGTALRRGQVVAMDYYALFPMPADEQAALCLTDPGTFEWVRRNARVLKAIMPAGDPILLGYDEMRQGNSCAGCRAKQMTAGQLLAWNVGKTLSLYDKILKGTPLYVWNDMFDPYHNAHKNYFYVEGDLAGSWKGLPGAVGVLNWNLRHLRDSLTWFSGTDPRQPVAHNQIIAGYYDSSKADSATRELNSARGIPGLQGIMYVSWQDDYSQLEGFAEYARRAWGAYLASLTAPPRSH